CAIKLKTIDFVDFIDYIDEWLRGGANSTQMSAKEPMPTFEFPK
ncbi:very short patch repair endonuclease, partial [Salmonella enterica subsp. enterica serovar Anderlecht]|nr:very short patch repair endonuclease [Salmonella enterica subsp. enterica serovar Anderlecht]MIX11028.1 very short patch repair endonuclease [Salmonella enterica subsp. enterica serovar Anderlecht]